MDAAPFATRDTFLAHVDALLDRTVRAEGLPGRAARRLVLAGGAKRARPSLCFLLAEHIGLRERVSNDGLQRHTDDGKTRPRHTRQEHARQTNTHYDGMIERG